MGIVGNSPWGKWIAKLNRRTDRAGQEWEELAPLF